MSERIFEYKKSPNNPAPRIRFTMLLFHQHLSSLRVVSSPFIDSARMNKAAGRKKDKEVPAIVPMKEKTVEISLIMIAMMTSATKRPNVIA